MSLEDKGETNNNYNDTGANGSGIGKRKIGDSLLEFQSVTLARDPHENAPIKPPSAATFGLGRDVGGTCSTELHSRRRQQSHWSASRSEERDSSRRDDKNSAGPVVKSKGKKEGRQMDQSEAQRELLSQCSSSHASTSFVSSSIFGGSRSTSLNDGAEERSATQDTNGLKLEASKANGEGVKCLLGQTAVSQSMLDLDRAVNAEDKFAVVWQNLTFSYEKSFKAKRAPVLCDLSGHFKSNELVAVIGPSGCGKTTLLQFLAGNEATQQERMRIIGLEEPKVAFIGQEDNLLPGLTARETLMYASRLQNTKPGFNHQEHIQPILNELGLAECSQRYVTKLSGGQAKRVTIAQELLYPTNLLILDEVTSGLDASTSYSIVRLLKYLVSDCSYPMSIVMSIHQPSARLFSVFDRVYVMSEGKCLYEGSCQVEEVNKYLGQFNLQCPRFHNIADYLIEIACSSKDDVLSSGLKLEPSSELQEEDSQTAPSIHAIKEQMIEFQRKKNQDLLATMGKEHCKSEQQTCGSNKMAEISLARSRLLLDGSSMKRTSIVAAAVQEQSVSLLLNGDSHHPSDGQAKNHSLYAAIERARSKRARPFWEQFLVHFGRSILRIRRSAILTYLQLLTYVMIGLQLATFYGPDIGLLSGCPHFQSNLIAYILGGGSSASSSDEEMEELGNKMRRIQENMNFLLVTVLTSTFAALEITVITFPMEAKTVKREWRNGWYKVNSYFLGRTLADLPFTIVFVFIFSSLVYVMTGQIGLYTWRFGAFLGVVLMTALVAQSFGFIFGAAFMDNLPAAVFTAPLAIFPALLFSGFFSRISQIPSFYFPMTYLSHFRYCFDALLVALYGYNRCECDQAALDDYHATLQNQTDSMRDMFHLLIGCETLTPTTTTTTTTSTTTPVPPLDDNLISHEDMAAINASNPSLGALLASTVAAQSASTSAAPAPMPAKAAASNSIISSLEDAILNGLFERTNQSSAEQNLTSAALAATTVAPDQIPFEEMNALDRMAYRFSTRVTHMLSKQSNFGHPMPRECKQFNSYLMQEFDLHDKDLITSLVVLFMFVLVTRLMCNVILNFTIARRAR